MQNVHILKYMLPTFGLIMLAFIFDSYIVQYLPRMRPIQTIKTLKQQQNFVSHLSFYFLKWNSPWIIAWVMFHILLLKNLFDSLKCQKIDFKQNNKIQTTYQVIQTQQDYQNQTIQTPKVQHQDQNKIIIKDIQNQSQGIPRLKTENDSVFKKIIYPYITTFVAIFIIVLFTMALIEHQISSISHESKNGSHNSLWMGSKQYFTLDFFHNIPKQYRQNHKLLQLFDLQDKSVSTVMNWIANYKLFFSLFYLLFKYSAPIGMAILFFLIFLSLKINLNEDKIRTQKRLKLLSVVKHTSQFTFFNLIFGLFLSFSLFSAIFLELKIINGLQLCSNQQPKGGFILGLDKRIQTQVNFEQEKIISEVLKIHPQPGENSLSSNKHQILFVFENICQIFTPFYKKIINLQEIFLFSMRLGETFFGLTILLLLFSKYKENSTNSNST